ncbi:MAG: hypothetical protein ACR2PB_04275 [Desulfocapsaceae bacterium]
MEKHGLEHLDKPGASGSVVHYIIIALLILVIVILLLVFFLSPDSIDGLRSSIGSSSSSQSTTGITDSSPTSGNENSKAAGSQELSQDLTGSTENQNDGSLTQSGTAGQAMIPGSDKNITQGSGDGYCSGLADNVESFFNTLDTRDYIKEFQLDSPSAIYFPELIQKLVDNPPIVSGETDDLFTILQNTAHFFRIIGKKNILVLKGILDREQATFEQILADFYQLTGDPDCLKDRFNLTIGQDPLYAYAGFFLNTMGGRLYLFRRDSMSRMVVNFYAILIIEKANQEGRNKHGIDIKDSIDSLIIEIESSRIKLKMRDFYLDTLYDMKVKYQ